MAEITSPAIELASVYLPRRLADAVTAFIESGQWCAPDEIDEIRLRRGRPVSLTARGKNIITDLICSETELSDTLFKLCGGTMHTHSDTIARGYISFGNGGRAGICGRAVVGQAAGADTAIANIRDADALSIRVPRGIRGISARLCDYIASRNYMASVLIYSPPGGGKTTLLRDAARTLTRAPHSRRVAVIDTRGELYREDMFRDTIADIFTGYPKAAGIEIATRTMSPQYLICDEIGAREEARAIIEALHSGVPLLATAHAESFDELKKRPHIKMLLDTGVFERCMSVAEASGI